MDIFAVAQLVIGSRLSFKICEKIPVLVISKLPSYGSVIKTHILSLFWINSDIASAILILILVISLKNLIKIDLIKYNIFIVKNQYIYS